MIRMITIIGKRYKNCVSNRFLNNSNNRKARNNPKKGITLVEMTLYVAIFSIFMSFALGFFWQMQKARVRSDLWREGKEVATQSINLLKSQIRNSTGLDLAGSQLGLDFSTLSMNTASGTALFDTTLKSVVAGGNPIEIRKLRLSLPALPAEEVTSDHVTVTRFRVDDVGGGGTPTSFRIQLSLASVNPGADPLYDSTLDSSVTISLRTEQ